MRCPACPSDQLCSSCRGQVRAWNASSAYLAGLRWAADVRLRHPTRRWPAWAESPAMQEEARRRVAAIASGDPELTEEFARRCAAAAREEWYFPGPRAGVVAGVVGETKRERRVRLWGVEAVARAERDGYRDEDG